MFSAPPRDEMNNLGGLFCLFALSDFGMDVLFSDFSRRGL